MDNLRKTLGCLLLFLFAAVTSTYAQVAKQYSGTVTDADSNEPVIGVNVTLKDAQTGTVTDLSGKFSISAPVGSTLLFSYIGYVTKEVKLGTNTSLKITMQEDQNQLSEVVVIGYGAVKKSDITGAVASVSSKQFKDQPVKRVEDILQGRTAGVAVTSVNGLPGGTVKVRVRGTTSLNTSNDPLYVIDGIMSGGLDVNPADIQSIEVLKDASATAIYGAQGSNGVVLITTKRGKAGEAKFTYDGMFAVQRQTKRLDMMNLREYATYYNDLANMGEISDPSNYYADPSLLGVGTNWQDAIFQTALQHQHQISAQGGTEKIQYYVSASYMDQDGTIIGSNFNRYSFRANLDAQLKKWLKLGLTATYTATGDDLKLADSDEGLINYSLTTLPDIPIYNLDGSYATVVREGYTNPNPIALAMMDDILLDRQKLTGNIFFEVTPIKNLVWHAELGYDISSSKGERYKPMVDLGGWVRSSNESNIQKNSSTFWQLKNYVTYSGNIGDKHHYTAMVGQECWESSYDFTSVFNSGLPSDEVHNPALGTGTPTINAGFGSSSMASFFTRLTYNYADRYLGTYTYRYDGSSNFGPENRWAGFHSLATSWRFSNETFFEPLKKVISNGKLRLGWGQTGNANIGGYAWGTSMSRMPSGLGMGYRPSNIPNTSIKWESQEQWNVGVDLGFLHDRINLTVEWYKKTSSDMLMPLQLPSYMGTSGNASSALAAPKGNYGDIENTGFEISLNTHPITGKFEWDSDFQISFNKNKLKGLAGTANAQIVGYGQWTDVVSVSSVGESLYNFYGFVCDGVYKDLEDLQTSPKPAKYPANGVFDRTNTVWVGDVKYKDISGPDGVPDGVIDDYDKTNIGSPMPKFTFGWTNTFRYKNFDLSVFINGSYGNKVYNYLSMKLTHMNSPWTNQLNAVNGRAQLVPINPNKVYEDGTMWYNDVSNVMVANPGASIPRATINDPNDNDRISDRYIEDGSYIRLKNISLGYTFPKKTIDKLGLSNLRIYANIQNLLTITGYDGYDPEIGASTSSVNVYGLDNGRYPSPTVYSFGLNVSF